MSARSDAARIAYDEDRIAQWVAEGGLHALLYEHETLEDANEYFRSAPTLAQYTRALEDAAKLSRIEKVLAKLQVEAGLGDLSGGHYVFLGSAADDYGAVLLAEQAIRDILDEFPQWAPTKREV